MALRDEKYCMSGLAIVVMGVSGAGKTTIGKLLAEALGCPFLDADDFHSKGNIEKMRSGTALTDDDRIPWLEDLSNALAKYISHGKQVVLACSALKLSYREILRQAAGFAPAEIIRNGDHLRNKRVVFVYLKGSLELIAMRLASRFKDGNHYMPPSLLKSQMETLEMSSKEEDIVTVDPSIQPSSIVDELVRKLSWNTSS